MAKIKWDEMPGFLGWNRVKSLRKLEKLSQAEVAERSGISIATLYNIEHGYEKTTTQETKEKLAKFFKCDVEDIFPAEMIGNLTKDEYERQKKIDREKEYKHLVRQKEMFQELMKMISVEEKLWLMKDPAFYDKRLQDLAVRYGIEKELFRALMIRISLNEKAWLMEDPRFYDKRLKKLAKRYGVEILPEK